MFVENCGNSILKKKQRSRDDYFLENIWSYKNTLQLSHLCCEFSKKNLKELGSEEVSNSVHLKKFVITTFLYRCKKCIISVVNLLSKYRKDWEVEYREWTIRVKSLHSLEANSYCTPGIQLRRGVRILPF